MDTKEVNLKKAERDFDDMRKAYEKARDKVSKAEREYWESKIEHLKPLAERAHGVLCNWSHCDGCGWGYENGNWEGKTHQSWLKWVAKMTGIKTSKYDDTHAITISEDEMTELLNTYEELKSRNPKLAHVLRTFRTP